MIILGLSSFRAKRSYLAIFGQKSISNYKISDVASLVVSAGILEALVGRFCQRNSYH